MPDIYCNLAKVDMKSLPYRGRFIGGFVNQRHCYYQRQSRFPLILHRP